MNGVDVLRLVTGIMKKDGMLGFYASYFACCLLTGFLTALNHFLKTKLMVDRHSYNGLFHCIAKIFVTGNGGLNPMALLDGAAARVAWLAPYTGVRSKRTTLHYTTRTTVVTLLPYLLLTFKIV